MHERRPNNTAKEVYAKIQPEDIPKSLHVFKLDLSLFGNPYGSLVSGHACPNNFLFSLFSRFKLYPCISR